MIFLLLLFEVTFSLFFKDKKVIKKSQKSRSQGFSCYFSLMMKDPDPYFVLMDPGDPKTYGSGSSTLGKGTAPLLPRTESGIGRSLR
jgi:hypothetical protein